MADWKAEGRIAIYLYSIILAKEHLGVSGDELESASNTDPLPEQAHAIMGIVEQSGYVLSGKGSSYRDAWQRLYGEVFYEKTSWGKGELKKRMDKMLIEEMERYL